MQWIVLDETGSTTQAAREKLLTQPLPFAVLARRQTAGQGQWGRVWVHEAGNLAMTVAWPKAAVSEAMLPQVGYLVALAVRAAAGQGGASLQFKWPN
ncbi:MAG: biotin--[acetyl-CoA-carboxylase] ligase, partial [Holosporales bacterium]